MGYDQMEDGGPFFLMVAAVSRQKDQWQQDHWQRSTTDQQQGAPRSEDGGQQLAAKQHLSGSAVPPIANQAGGSRGHQSDGGQAGAIGISHAALRDAIYRPRGRVLPGPTPKTTD